MILYLFIILLIIFLLIRNESFLAPWDVDKCKQFCFMKGETTPWFGGNISWRDPSISTTTFDVAGCMANCNLSTWY